jgi:hypothetical protein
MVLILEELVEWMSGRGNRSTRKELATMALCPPQIRHDLSRARTWAATVGTGNKPSEVRHGHLILRQTSDQ